MLNATSGSENAEFKFKHNRVDYDIMKQEVVKFLGLLLAVRQTKSYPSSSARFIVTFVKVMAGDWRLKLITD